jgi:multiple sugar transport system substrate-binding protein
MTRRFKSLLSVFLSGAIILSLSACEELNETENPSETEVTRVTNAADESVRNVVKDIQFNAPDVTVTKKISWLSWWDIDETAADAELFKYVYGIPQEGGKPGEENNIFTTTKVSYEDRYTKLATMINSGDSPDIFPFEINCFPHSVVKGMFVPIDGIVDTYSKEYAHTRELMDQFMWGGKNYCAIPTLNLADNLLWYRKSVVANAGLQDPYELYKKGEWNWNTFLEMAEVFQNSGEDKFIIDGWGVDNAIVASTGTPLISIQDGKLKTNFYNEDIERALDFITKLQTENYRYDRTTLNDSQVNQMHWANGSTLFFADGFWFMQEGLPRFIKRFGWDKEDVFFVPMPKDPEADKYYMLMKQDAFMLVSGSDNIEGFQAWQACVVAAANDEATRLVMREKNKNDYEWTDAQLDFLDELTRSGVIAPVFDFKNGIGEDLADNMSGETPIESLTKTPYTTGTKTYSQIRESISGLIEARIEELNATLNS